MKRLKKINKALIALIIFLTTATILNFNPVATVLNVNPVYATPEIYIWDDHNNSNIINSSMVTGTLFNITAWITGYTGVFAWQVQIKYNNAIINCTRVWVADFRADYIFAKKPGPRVPVTDMGVGYVTAADSLVTQTSASSPPDPDPASLAIFEFEVKGTGYSVLNINHENTYILDDYLNKIPITKTNGSFDNRLPKPLATMYVDPPKVDDPTLVPCSNFNVTVNILDASEIISFEFKLGFNQTLLNVVDAYLGDFFPAPPATTVTKTINNAAGYVLFNASLVLSQAPISGDGTLAIIEFHVESFGVTVLNLFDTKLIDQSQKPPVDGFFKNLKGAKLYVSPPEIRSPLLKPPAVFTIDIVIDDVENLYGYELWLGYNTKMLTAIGVDIHPILDEYSFTSDWMVKDSKGHVWINVTYYPPATPITTYDPESLVTITFKVDAVGSSVLDLYDTKLLDPTGAPIGHEVTDGFVMTEIHDVAIVNVVPSETFVFAGALVDINVTAKNKGNTTETFDVKAYYDSTLVGTKTVTDLPPNTETTLKFSWDTSGVSDGIYRIKANATFVLYEFNTTDNEYIDGTVEVMTRIRDLAVISVTVDPNVTYAHPSWPVNITVVVENQGMDPENFDVTVYWNETHLIGKQTVDNLPPSTSKTLFFIWDTTNELVCHKYLISANATILEFEMDTADNRQQYDGYVKIKIMGDINSDGKVDIADIAIAAKAFGSYPGHPRWEADINGNGIPDGEEADVNRDDKVDIRDLAMVASNFGKTCSS